MANVIRGASAGFEERAMEAAHTAFFKVIVAAMSCGSIQLMKGAG